MTDPTATQSDGSLDLYCAVMEAIMLTSVAYTLTLEERQELSAAIVKRIMEGKS